MFLGTVSAEKTAGLLDILDILEQQQQAASLVVVGAQQDQGGGVLSPCLLQQHKATNHEAALFCTRRSGRSLKTRQGGAKG